MSNPIRYNVKCGDEGYQVAESLGGEWVRYSDYACLKADLQNCYTAIRVKDEENTRLKAEAERRTAQYNGIIDTQLKAIDELKAEVERLEHQVRYWRIEAECDHGRWLRCLEDLEKLRNLK